MSADASDASSSDEMSVGVDVCRAGWIAIARTAGGWAYRLHPSFANLLDTWRSVQGVLVVGIPIGLPWPPMSQSSSTVTRPSGVTKSTDGNVVIGWIIAVLRRRRFRCRPARGPS